MNAAYCDNCVVVCQGQNAFEDSANHHCYFLVSAGTWSAVESLCTSAGGDLAAITTAAELGLVDGKISSTATVWIGGNDQATEGDYVWSDQEPWSFAPWVKHQPGNDKEHLRNCVSLEPAQSGISSDACGNSVPGLCERPPLGM
jgi:hypothetical protein